MDDARIPAEIEASGLIRAVEAAGGFGTVLARGEKHAGTLLVVCCHKGTDGRAYERMPRADGTRAWTLSKRQDPENPWDFSEFCDRRRRQDSDLWIVELDHEQAQGFLDPDLAAD